MQNCLKALKNMSCAHWHPSLARHGCRVLCVPPHLRWPGGWPAPAPPGKVSLVSVVVAPPPSPSLSSLAWTCCFCLILPPAFLTLQGAKLPGEGDALQDGGTPASPAKLLPS